MAIKLMKYSPQVIMLKEGLKTANGEDVAVEVPTDIQLLRVGSFSYWEPGDMDINQGTLLSMVQNFDRKVRGVDLAIDYGHDCFGEAAGWIEKLYLSEDGNALFASIKWTPEGAAKLAGK